MQCLEQNKFALSRDFYFWLVSTARLVSVSWTELQLNILWNVLNAASLNRLSWIKISTLPSVNRLSCFCVWNRLFWVEIFTLTACLAFNIFVKGVECSVLNRLSWVKISTSTACNELILNLEQTFSLSFQWNVLNAASWIDFYSNSLSSWIIFQLLRLMYTNAVTSCLIWLPDVLTES